ncbi:hypothetical protein B0H13DRAFT_979517 [Mycena leptocephala]|nr:hypothetical protein B0H13DRAFT_979517 [Mycena leptocephala]
MAPGPVALTSRVAAPCSPARGLPPQHLLPIELWEAILQLVLSDKDLLRISTVCAAFNVLCIHIVLSRNEYSEEIFSAPSLVVPPQLLGAFHLSFRTFPFRQFECHLGPAQLRQDLAFVGEIIRRSKELRELTLTFHRDLFSIDPDEFSIDPDEALFTTLCSGLSDIATRMSGPVMIISGPHIFSCRRQDIAKWNLHLFEFNGALGLHGLILRVRRALKLKESPPPSESFWTQIRLHDGRIGLVPVLKKLHSATVQSIFHARGPLRFFTILTFNASSTTYLYLDQNKYPATISTDELSALIIHISLPALHTLKVSIDTIDPAALGQFLMNHAFLRHLEYTGRGDRFAQRPLIHPPIAHPRLSTISTVAVGNHSLGRAISGLDTSPRLHTFSFTFSSSESTTNLAGLIQDLRRISLRTNDTELDIVLWEPMKKRRAQEFWATSEEVCDVARRLHCIRTVDLSCWSVDVGVRMFPWLALIPAVLNIRFGLRIKRYGQNPSTEEEVAVELAKFLDDAHTALGHIPQITGRAW